ncbi:MAG: YggS family pyridoxal phosphate-dependent enzyme [Planctomycetota bacterium]
MAAIELDIDRFLNNRARLLAEITELAAAAQRPTPEVVVVTKYVDAAATATLLERGIAPLGENRVADLTTKTGDLTTMPSAATAAARWHFIGHLQRNKVGRALGRFGLLHSLDNRRLAATIVAEGAKLNVPPCRCLVQVNVSGEASKGGVSASDSLQKAADEVLSWIESFPTLEIAGLMTMAPQLPSAACRPLFGRLRELRDLIQAGLSGRPKDRFRELSMGMSNDYREAVQEGATLLRLGRILYQ